MSAEWRKHLGFKR